MTTSNNLVPAELVDSFVRVTEKIDQIDYSHITEFWLKLHANMGRKMTAPFMRCEKEYLEKIGALGRCAEDDAVIMIHPRALKWEPIGLDTLLAHELAHILHIQLGTVRADKEEEEAQVADTLERWGYQDDMITICNEQAKNFPNESIEQVRERIRLYRLAHPEHE